LYDNELITCFVDKTIQSFVSNVVFISKGEMAQLRLKAGCCMLKLAQEPVYADAIKLEQFQTLALLASVSY